MPKSAYGSWCNDKIAGADLAMLEHGGRWLDVPDRDAPLNLIGQSGGPISLRSDVQVRKTEAL